MATAVSTAPQALTSETSGVVVTEGGKSVLKLRDTGQAFVLSERRSAGAVESIRGTVSHWDEGQVRLKVKVASQAGPEARPSGPASGSAPLAASPRGRRRTSRYPVPGQPRAARRPDP